MRPWDLGEVKRLGVFFVLLSRRRGPQGRVRMRAWLGGEGVPLGDGADSIVSVLPAGGLLAGLAELLDGR